MTAVTNLLPVEEPLMHCMFGYIGTGLQKLYVRSGVLLLGNEILYMWRYSGITVNHTVLNFVLIFKSIHTISYWGTRQVLSVLVSYSSVLTMLNLLCVVCVKFSWSFYRLGVLLMFYYFFCFHVISEFHSAWSSQENKNHGKVVLKTSCCLGCALLGSTRDPGDRITGSVPSLGLGSGLECHCLNTNGCTSGVVRAVLLQRKGLVGPQSIPETILRKWWSLSSIQHWGHPCLWRTFILWHADMGCHKSIYRVNNLVHWDVKQFRGGMHNTRGKQGQNLGYLHTAQASGCEVAWVIANPSGSIRESLTLDSQSKTASEAVLTLLCLCKHLVTLRGCQRSTCSPNTGETGRVFLPGVSFLHMG